LGGRTKTYIIATVSPAQQNHEELRSTLDYASHASSISNQPQANSPIHQERQVDKLVKMLESTHDELRVTQEKFGVYVPKKTFDGMKNEIQLLKEQAIAKDITIQDYKNVEKQHKEQIKYAVDELKLKLKEMEDQISIINREKEELKTQHQEKESKMEKEAQSKQKKLEMDFSLKEKRLIDAIIEKDEQHQKELQKEKRNYDDLVHTTEQFRKELNKSNNTMWESFLLKTKSNSISYSQNSHPIREGKTIYF
jgi:kinesin family protein 11